MTQFHSLQQFLQMGGYGVYVWAAYGVVSGGMVITILRTWLKSRRVRRQR